MILSQKVRCVFGSRYHFISPFSSIWAFGNSLFTWGFNYFHSTNLIDALCCAKAFYKKDINQNKLMSLQFDIDIEIASHLIKKVNDFKTVKISYKRRGVNEGKKLSIKDSWAILIRILKN